MFGISHWGVSRSTVWGTLDRLDKRFGTRFGIFGTKFGTLSKILVFTVVG